MHDQARTSLWRNVLVQVRAARRLVRTSSLLAAGTVLMSAILFVRIGGRARADEASSLILVASQYIPAFSPVQRSLVTPREYPRSLQPPGALRSLDDLQTEAGRPLFTAAVPFPKDQPITRAALIDSRKSRAMAFMLPPGKVAVALMLDKAHSAGGWIGPGDRVSLYHTLRASEASVRGAAQTRLLFPSVTVLAVDKKRQEENVEPPHPPKADFASLVEQAEDETGGSLLTLAVYPPEALMLIQAREQGRVTAVLRASTDDEEERLVRH